MKRRRVLCFAWSVPVSFWQSNPILAVSLILERSPHEPQRAWSRQPVRVACNDARLAHVPPIVTCLPATSSASAPVDDAFVTSDSPESRRK